MTENERTWKKIKENDRTWRPREAQAEGGGPLRRPKGGALSERGVLREGVSASEREVLREGVSASEILRRV